MLFLLPAATKLWPRLCFYTCLWFCSQGGGSPGRKTPPGREELPLGRENPLPRSRHPPGRENPPGAGRTPPGKQTAAYGQWAAGTYPTGMHSCYSFTLKINRYPLFLFTCILIIKFCVYCVANLEADVLLFVHKFKVIKFLPVPRLGVRCNTKVLSNNTALISMARGGPHSGETLWLLLEALYCRISVPTPTWSNPAAIEQYTKVNTWSCK